MPQKAEVRSLDAIEVFRSSLIVYLSQARPALEEVSAQVLRIRLWLCPLRWTATSVLRTYSLLSRPEAQRVGRAMVAAVPVERGWHLVMGGRRVRHLLGQSRH